LAAQVLIGDECLIRFSGVELGAACTVVIRGATQQVIDEAERSLHDALCVLAATVREPKVVHGGGSHPLPLDILHSIIKPVLSKWRLIGVVASSSTAVTAGPSSPLVLIALYNYFYFET
jgi:hypothetical protein